MIKLKKAMNLILKKTSYYLEVHKKISYMKRKVKTNFQLMCLTKLMISKIDNQFFLMITKNNS